MKYLPIKFCDSCYNLVISGSLMICAREHKVISSEKSKLLLIPIWCRLPNAPLTSKLTRPDNRGPDSPFTGIRQIAL